MYYSVCTLEEYKKSNIYSPFLLSKVTYLNFASLCWMNESLLHWPRSEYFWNMILGLLCFNQIYIFHCFHIQSDLVYPATVIQEPLITSENLAESFFFFFFHSFLIKKSPSSLVRCTNDSCTINTFIIVRAHAQNKHLP